MSKGLNIAAKALSIALYPLFLPTYAMCLFCYSYSMHIEFPLIFWSLLVIGSTFLLTCIVPVVAIYIMVKMGKVQDFYIDLQEQRATPYMVTLICFCCWYYLLSRVLQVPQCVTMAIAGSTFALSVVSIINFGWKISAHLTGFGCFLGGIMSYCLGIEVVPSWWILGPLFGISLLLMYARIGLKAHTPAQVIIGWLWGLACSISPYMIFCLVHHETM
ncbi:MAG: hypothetical protein J5761_02025 [Paludibacteraceae bacterium]|nr:hypothetical protein [Paludibacteraceae bacterium]